jgi:hypothetical protein
MAKLIYSMIMSLDGYVHEKFGCGAPEDLAIHSYINELGSSVGGGERFFPDGVRLDLRTAVRQRRDGRTLHGRVGGRR